MTGKELVKMIIATDTFGRFVILQAPEYVKYLLDGEAYCEDRYFDKSTLPTESGVYEAECEIYWDDGTSYHREPNVPDWQISVVSYRLLPLETVNGKGSPICPQCGGRNCQETGSVFYEKGEYDGSTYEEEGYATEYICFSCRTAFFIKEAQPQGKGEKCRYCGSTDIAYRDGEIVACSRCYAKMQNTFFEPSVQTSVGSEEKQAARFPETLHTVNFGTFSLSRILPNGEAVYLGNELNTQGYEIRIADMGDYFAGLRNFQVSDDDDFLSNFDGNGKEII